MAGSRNWQFSHSHNQTVRRIVFPLLLACAFAGGLLANFANAQTPPTITPDDQLGFMPYASYHGGDIDSVSLGTGNLVIEAPILSYPQRGSALKLQFNLYYNGHALQTEQLCPPKAPSCYLEWHLSGYCCGARVSDSDLVGISQILTQQIICSNCDPELYEYQTLYQVGTADDAVHPLGLLPGTGGNCGTSDSAPPYLTWADWGTFESLDGTGWQAQIPQPTPAMQCFGFSPPTVIGPDGVQYTNGGTQRQDTNGNQITLNTSSGIITDTVGRQIPAGPNSTASTSLCPAGAFAPTSASYWTPPAYNGASAQYLFCYASIPVNISPGALPYTSNGWTKPITMLQSITLPNGLSWIFAYDDTDGTTWKNNPTNYGSLTQITLPTGGTIQYSYATISGVGDFGSRWVVSRTVNDATGSHTWNYSYGTPYIYPNTTGAPTVVTDPLLNDTTHQLERWGSYGTPYEIQTQYYQGSHTSGTLLKTVTTAYQAAATGANVLSASPMVPVTTTTTWPSSQISKTTKAYDNNNSFTYVADYNGGTSGNTFIYGKVTGESVYDYPSGSSLLRTRTTQYEAFVNSNYLNENLLNLPSSVQVTGSGGNSSSTYYSYDGSPLQSTNASLGTAESYPGNLTSIQRLQTGSTTATTNCNVSVSDGNLVSTKTYYNTGEVYQSTDPCGYATTYLYSSGNTGALPTSITNALGQATTYGYDSDTGAVTSITDPNQQTTTKTYDILTRLASVNYPDGGSIGYCYTDVGGSTCSQSGPPYSVVKTTAITSALSETFTYSFDVLGRLSQTQLNSDPSGIDYTLTTYDPNGRKSQVYNPTRCSSITSNCNSETTWGYTTTNYDALSRVTSVVEQDNSIVSTSYATTPPSGYNGYCTTATDEVGNSRQSCVDGLGHMTVVVEDPGSSPHLNYSTTYSYDALGDLTNVIQNGSRQRQFSYDSLSELTSATNPESGTISYAYDADGNVITKTAPSPNQGSTGTATVATTYTYDMLNRLAGKSYSDSDTKNPATAQVLFWYDGATPSGCTPKPPVDPDSYPIGRRTAMCDGSGATSWTHDKMGRPLKERRTIGTVSNEYDNEAYNLDGSVSLVNGLGYEVFYTYNKARQPIAAFNESDPFTFATGATYAPPGELTGVSLGATPITVTDAYNDRLQPILLSAATTSTTLFSECFDFHLGVAITTPSQCALAAYTTGDNGNVYTIANERTSTRSQSFTYDSLNRIGTAQSSGTQWGETYTIDAWGNLTTIGQVSGKSNHESLSQSALSNNQLTGFTYDAAGNMTVSGSETYTYDAENRLIATAGTSYVYDGDGDRVEKCTEGTTPGTCASGATGTMYWRGTSSDPQVETDLSGNVLENYIFLGGKRIARRDGSTAAVHFYFSDHLGSHGVVVNATGSTCEQDIDYYPYGGQENDYCPNVAQNYKFTGKERDSESGLDNFGKRYFGSSLGRFQTPDPFNPIFRFRKRSQFDAFLAQPQNWNQYPYAWNNPLRFADPSGESVYIVLYTTGNKIGGDDELKRAAQTKANEIETSKGFDPKKDTVLVAGVKTKADVTNAFKAANDLGKAFGGVQQLNMFSHSGIEGPVLHGGPVDTLHPNGGTQFTSEELKSLPALNWNQGATATFFGCNTTTFAGQFANDERITSFGTTGTSYFSSRPDRMAPDSGGSLYLIDTYFNHVVPNFMNYTSSMEEHEPQ
jgi:RHS repeat-associated protein